MWKLFWKQEMDDCTVGLLNLSASCNCWYYRVNCMHYLEHILGFGSILSRMMTYKYKLLACPSYLFSKSLDTKFSKHYKLYFSSLLLNQIWCRRIKLGWCLWKRLPWSSWEPTRTTCFPVCVWRPLKSWVSFSFSRRRITEMMPHLFVGIASLHTNFFLYWPVRASKIISFQSLLACLLLDEISHKELCY